MAGAEGAQGESRILGIDALFDQLADHANETRMSANRAGANEIESEFTRFLLSFFVQIVEDFHVVGDEADGNDDDVW